MQSRITLDTQLKITLIFSCVVGCYDYFAYGFTLFFRKALCCEKFSRTVCWCKRNMGGVSKVFFVPRV